MSDFHGYLSNEIIRFMEKRVTPFGTGTKVDCPEREFILLYVKIEIHKFYFCPTPIMIEKFLFFLKI
jgi:putative transposon-encoded protein